MKILFRNRYGEMRSGWSLALAFLALALATLVMQLVTSAIFGIFLRSGMATEADAVIATPVAGAVQELAMTGAVILVFRAVYRRPLSQIGLAGGGCWAGLLHGCAIGVASIGVVFAFLVLSGQATAAYVGFNAQNTLPIALCFLNFITVGLFEEIYFRGYVMTALKTTRSQVFIFILSACIFSLLHAANPEVTALSLANIFLVGIVLAYMFTKTGSLWMPIGFHIGWNFFQGNILGIEVSGTTQTSLIDTVFTGPDWLTGGAFGAEGGVAVTVVSLICLAYLRFAVKAPKQSAWSTGSDLPLTRG
jgi:membrane protease YdiL (CAAX protease family)